MLVSLINKAADLKACNFINKRFQHRCFSVNIAKDFKNTYFEEHLQAAASVNRITVSLNYETMVSNFTRFFQEKPYSQKLMNTAKLSKKSNTLCFFIRNRFISN